MGRSEQSSLQRQYLKKCRDGEILSEILNCENTSKINLTYILPELENTQKWRI